VWYSGWGLIALAGALPRGSPPLARIYFAFAAACNSALIEYSQEARAYALASFLVGLVTVLLLRDLARARRDEKPLQPSWLQLAAMSAAMMTHYYAIPYCGLLVTLYGLAAARAGHRLRLVVLSAPFAPVALYLIWGLDGILFKLGSPVSHDTTMLLSLLRAVKETGRMVIPGLGGWMWLVVLAFPWAAWRVWCSLSGGRPAPSVPEPVWLTVVVLPFIVVLGVATRGMEFFHPRYLPARFTRRTPAAIPCGRSFAAAFAGHLCGDIWQCAHPGYPALASASSAQQGSVPRSGGIHHPALCAR
jgi:hypothetical protein